MVVRGRNLQAGFTLIELAVVLLIIGLLALAASPLTSSWTTNSDLHTAAGQLNQAYNHAKAAALRNASGAVGDEPAARIAFDPAVRELKVCKTPTGACSNVLWRATLPSGVKLSLTGVSLPVELNNRGQPVTPFTASLSKGGETDVHTFN
ncbi:pilus assembly FimT family protein [Pseudomonas profundi]|uniref:pilus assembly FimT family protein n=1 Tax=Pseudomonas profundi TaxID=1981513 RepID=UPI001680193E|nr:prepilin-type N-terminal cleavage/methylation domain-containing protein [Pseudomonas profundi]